MVKQSNGAQHDMVKIAARNGRIIKAYKSGESYQAIGERYSLTRERVRQILMRAAKKAGYANPVEAFAPKDNLPERLAEDLAASIKLAKRQASKPRAYTLAEAAEILGVDSQVIKKLAWKGRVPFAAKDGPQRWRLTHRSIKFLAKWLPRMGTGEAGQKAAGEMKRAARKLDNECGILQADYARAYPPGSFRPSNHPVKRKQRRRVSSKHLVPPHLKAAWSQTVSKDKVLRTMQLCVLLSEREGGGPFVLKMADLAKLARVDVAEAKRTLAVLAEQGTLSRRGDKVTLMLVDVPRGNR